jgi:Dolichyl-phosphate-mannose-protein mannosyltransferase
MSKQRTANQKTKTTQKEAFETQKSTPFQLPNWLPLSLILVATALLHLQYLDIPLERDESLYAYIGKVALTGGRPYIDFYEMKPPVLFYSYALFIALLGYSATGIHLAAAILAVVNTLFTYLIAKKLGGLPLAYLSAIVFVLWSLSPAIYGSYLLSENIAIAWGLPAILWALNYPKEKNLKQLFGVGFLLSMSFLTKQPAGVFAATVGLFWLSFWIVNRKTIEFGTFFQPLLWSILGFFVPITLTIIGLWAIGSGQEASFWLLEYPRLYTNSVNAEDAKLALDLMKQLVFTDYQGYFVATILGVLAVIISKRTVSQKIFLLTWVLFTVATVAIGKRYYGHYWTLAMPIMSILGAIFFQDLINWLRQKKGKIEAAIASIIAILWSIHILFIQPNYYFNPTLTEISRTFSPGNPFVEHQILSNYLKKIIQPTDKLIVFGSDPQFFIYLNKTSPIRHIYMPFFVNGKYSRAITWQNETIEGLKTIKPEYVIFNNYPIAWMYQPGYSQRMYSEIVIYLDEQYDVVAFIENPGMGSSVQIIEAKNGFTKPRTPSYISVLKRR